MDRDEPERVDWALELEDKIGGPRVEIAGTKRIGDRKIVTEIQTDDETGKRTKIVTEYKIITKRVSKAVAVRKNWSKFGDSAGEQAGPQPHTTKIAEEVQMQFLTGREDVMGVEAPTMLAKDKSKVACRICGGEHWTTQCQYQGASDLEKDALRKKFTGLENIEVATELPRAENTTGKYVPPSRREGFSGGTMMQTDQHPSVRVSNLPTDVKEDDLRELFEQFGKIKKVYLGKDKKTGDFKGFAFVTFFDQTSADKAIARVNGHRYFHMILSVDWANPSKS